MSNILKNFLSCDWGTTSFRLRLIETGNLAIVEEEKTSQGIAETFQSWKKSGKRENERLRFYLDIISKHIETIKKKTGISIDDLPIIISGMASSTIGMIDLPYKNVPFAASGEDLGFFTTGESENIKNKVCIISGVRTEDDVMRGEETKLVGCIADSNDISDIYIFPGTHPKHIVVKNSQAITFKTYMTGEFFELLSSKSILSVSVRKSEGFQAKDNLRSFTKGVNDSSHSSLLHNCFLVRTNELFKKNSLAENYFYLSGLLIGSELKNVVNGRNKITIVGNDTLNAQYLAALNALRIPGEETTIKNMDADKALIKGQWEIYKSKFFVES